VDDENSIISLSKQMLRRIGYLVTHYGSSLEALETYSEKTLLSLLNDTETFKKEGKSMSEEIYRHLIRAKGYHSLEEAENK